MSESLDSLSHVYENYSDKPAMAITGRVSVSQLRTLVNRITEDPDSIRQEFNVRTILYHRLTGLKVHTW